MTDRLHREEGSILLAMLAIITIGGMVAASFSLVRQSQDTSRRDRGYTEAIQVADAGIQQALGYLRAVDANGTLPMTSVSPATTIDKDGNPLVLDTSTNSGGFTWTATRNGFDWEIRAEGTVNGVTRRIEAVITRGQELMLAAFGDKSTTVNGSGGAQNVKSYDSQTGAATTDGGNVGSNGSVNINGGATDGVYLYGPASSCKKTKADGSCSGTDKTIKLNESINVDALLSAAVAEFNANCPNGAIDGPYVAAVHPPLVAGNTYCFSAMTMNASMTITGLDQDNPTRVYVTGNIGPGKGAGAAKTNTEWNCPGCRTTTQYGFEPAGLQITMTSETATMELNNQSAYGFILNAPKATCHLGAGQTTIYGAVLCGEIVGSGGWELFFDDAAARSGIGMYTVADWREEVGNNSTSF